MKYATITIANVGIDDILKAWNFQDDCCVAVAGNRSGEGRKKRGHEANWLLIRQSGKPHNLQTVFCPNMACHDKHEVGKGNIVAYIQKRQGCKCTSCGHTFSMVSCNRLTRKLNNFMSLVQIDCL
jgi:hypothetical protein